MSLVVTEPFWICWPVIDRAASASIGFVTREMLATARAATPKVRLLMMMSSSHRG